MPNRFITSNLPLSLLTQASFDGIVISDGGNIVWVNQAYADMVGYASAELIGRHVSEMASDQASVRDKVASEDTRPYEMLCLRKDGTRFMAEIRAMIVTHEGLRLRVAAVRDITGRRQTETALRESEERFRRLSEASFEGVVISEGGRVVDANDIYLGMVGYQLPEIIGVSVVDFVMPDDRAKVEHIVLSQSAEAYEASVLRKDGTPFVAEIRGKSVALQDRTLRVAAVRDITERKRMEEAVKSSEQRFR